MERYHYSAQDFSTKEGARAALLRLLEPLKPFYSPGVTSPSTSVV